MPAFAAAASTEVVREDFSSEVMNGESCVEIATESILAPSLWNDLEPTLKRRIYNGSVPSETFETHHSGRKSDQGLRGRPHPGGRCAGRFAGRRAGGVCGHCGAVGVGQIHAFLSVGRAYAGHRGARGDRRHRFRFAERWRAHPSAQAPHRLRLPAVQPAAYALGHGQYRDRLLRERARLGSEWGADGPRSISTI